MTHIDIYIYIVQVFFSARERAIGKADFQLAGETVGIGRRLQSRRSTASFDATIKAHGLHSTERNGTARHSIAQRGTAQYSTASRFSFFRCAARAGCCAHAVSVILHVGITRA